MNRLGMEIKKVTSRTCDGDLSHLKNGDDSHFKAKNGDDIHLAGETNSG